MNTTTIKAAAALATVGVVAWMFVSLAGATLNLPDVVPDVAVEQTDRSPALLVERLEQETVFVAASSDLIHEVDIENASTVAGWRIPWTTSRTTWRLVGLAEARIDLSDVDIARQTGGRHTVTIPAPAVTVHVDAESTDGYRCDHDPIAEVTGGKCANVDQLIDDAVAEMTATALGSGIIDEAERSFDDWLRGLAVELGAGPVDVLWSI